MKDLSRKATHCTPLIKFITTGNLSMTGSLYPENAKEFFDPLIEWVMALQTKEVNFEMTIEYLNSACSKKLFELLQRLMNNKFIETVHIKWYYQKGDEDAFETGKLLLETLHAIHFELIEFNTFLRQRL